jgi:uncharacterized membrane protein
MRMSRRDWIATALVVAAVLAYAVWLVIADNPAESAIRAMVATVLVLGFAASATAVVPGFAALIHGSKTYLVAASAIGLVALVAGVMAFVNASTALLAALVVATMVMWVMASLRHTVAH